MKKLLFIAALLFAGGLMAQSIPDGGFEYWNTATWMDPQGFTSSNAQGNGLNASFGLTPNVTRVAGKFGAGPYGAQISTIQIGNDTLGGFIINADVNGNGIKGGIPYSKNLPE